MELMRFVEHTPPKVKAPVFVEGLPGIGNVGKLAAQQLVDSLGARPWCDVFSTEFPPQVTVAADGTARLVRCHLWTAPAQGKAPPLVLMTGDHQPLTGQGQFALVEGVLERVAALGCTTLYTLGGYGVGAPVGEPDVLGAATDTKTVERLRKLGVKFAEEEPAGGIIGASGLFLGLGALRGFQGACLMGETNGYMVDPRAARAVLKVLEGVLGRTIDTTHLEEKARDLDRLTHQLQEGDAGPAERPDLNYIG